MPGILVTGGYGYLGAALLRLAPDAVGTRFSSAGPLVQLDVRDPDGVNALVRRIRPEVIIHTAYTTRAEDNWETTTFGAQNVARAAAAIGARLVHLSTDVVFDGGAGPYREGDTVNPITPYGKAKADEIIARCWDLEKLSSVTDLIGLDPTENDRTPPVLKLVGRG